MSEKKQESSNRNEKISDTEIRFLMGDLKTAANTFLSKIEKTKGKQKLNRGPLEVEHIKDGLFSLESHGFKTEFLYLKNGKEDIAHAITNDKANPLTIRFDYQLMTPDRATIKPLLAKGNDDIIALANFINYTKRFVQENKEKLQTRQINGSNVGPFFEENDGPGKMAIKYYSKDMFGKHTMLSGKNNFFDGGGSLRYNFNLLDYSEFNIGDPIIRIHDINNIIPFLNNVYEVQKRLQVSRLDIWRASQAKQAELKEDIESGNA